MKEEIMKEEILEILKDGEKSTSEITASVNRNYYDCLKYLEELEKEGILERINVNRYTFWKLNENSNENGSGYRKKDN